MIKDLYPNWDVLSQRGSWDEATRRVVLDRVDNVPSYAFFDRHQQRTLEALAAQVVPQEHRPAGRRVPIGPWIDRLCLDQSELGTRFAGMPPLREAWLLGLAGLDQSARAAFGADFADLDKEQRRAVLERVAAGHVAGGAWRRMPAAIWWQRLALRQIAGTYYAHPYAWDEIGFGGPAYPRGYFALHHGLPEPWEPREAEGYSEEELRAP